MSTETQGGMLSGDVLSAEERSFMESGGTTALEPAPVPPVPAPVVTDTTPADTGDATDLDDDGLDDDTDGPARDESGKFVSRSALLRVKEREKQTREALTKVATELIRHRERSAVLSELAARNDEPANQPQERDIDPTEDIFGAYAQLSKKLQAIEARVGESDAATRNQLEQMTLQAAATRDMQAFSAQEPAFLEAYKFLAGQRDAELDAMGMSDPRERQARIRQETRELVSGALKSNSSGAERIFKLAVARGFAKAAEPSAPGPLDQKATANIERINKGQKAAASLRNAGGTSDAGQALTPQRLADMSDREFSEARTAYIGKHGVHAWDRLIGGG
jgi:hypothetical protein